MNSAKRFYTHANYMGELDDKIKQLEAQAEEVTSQLQHLKNVIRKRDSKAWGHAKS